MLIFLVPLIFMHRNTCIITICQPLEMHAYYSNVRVAQWHYNVSELLSLLWECSNDQAIMIMDIESTCNQSSILLSHCYTPGQATTIM